MIWGPFELNISVYKDTNEFNVSVCQDTNELYIFVYKDTTELNISYKYDNIIYLEQIYHQGDLKKTTTNQTRLSILSFLSDFPVFFGSSSGVLGLTFPSSNIGGGGRTA